MYQIISVYMSKTWLALKSSTDMFGVELYRRYYL